MHATMQFCIRRSLVPKRARDVCQSRLVRNRLFSTTAFAAQNDYVSIANENVDKVLEGKYKLHKLEDHFGTSAAVLLRREAIAEKTETTKGLEELPAFGQDFDAEQFYDQVHGVNCENVIGFLPIPVGVIGPLRVNDKDYYVPLATTEGALLASTNRGARAIREAGGASARVTKDMMSRSPVLECRSSSAAAEFAQKVEGSMEEMKAWFQTQTNFGKLESVDATVAGRYVYLRFRASTGDAMGMNMVGKGVNHIVKHLVESNEGVKLLALSSNMCTDKKPSALNWVTGRGKSVVCEAELTPEIVQNVLNTTVKDLVKTHTIKNLIGSSLAGSIGGNNAHASNIVSAAFIATGQDPAQNVESSNCLLVLEELKNGNLHASVVMPCIEVGTVGGGTSLPSQRACLNMLGVGGAHRDIPGDNAKELAQIVAGAVLAGELSLNSALASNELISAHMDLNRKKDTPVSTSPGMVKATSWKPPSKRLSLQHDVPNSRQHHRGQFTARRIPTKPFSLNDVCSTLSNYYAENDGFQTAKEQKRDLEEENPFGVVIV